MINNSCELIANHPSIPESIAQLLAKEFGSPPIAQVATVGDEGPMLRSMGMFSLLEGAFPLFLTHCATHKWDQLTARPQTALCFVNTDKNKQVLARGKARLHTLESNPALLERFWPKVPSTVLSVYAQEGVEEAYQESDLTPALEKIPSNFGVIQIIPHFWEELIFNAEDYVKSTRIQHTLSSKGWLSSRRQVC